MYCSVHLYRNSLTPELIYRPSNYYTEMERTLNGVTYKASQKDEHPAFKGLQKMECLSFLRCGIEPICVL